ncbi:hypothetical protein EGY05_18085 [Chryseobacterium arthrosphaerae]|uniref:hypothetical protein n=1 Tax=Chryseobacterium arthrosphaerae TaxID=651561 RepID=UPI000F4F7257|nr:hypothetical protein [Chryseobacterium arthrosphaerae]AYZ13732.1 hypothetical protein EGY05_18085 [Chryseobacterium arthrosphaerae]
MKQTDNIIKADPGKCFKRKTDGVVFGDEIYLGTTYYLDGIRLQEPIQETPDDFEEIDIEMKTEEMN